MSSNIKHAVAALVYDSELIDWGANEAPSKVWAKINDLRRALEPDPGQCIRIEGKRGWFTVLAVEDGLMAAVPVRIPTHDRPPMGGGYVATKRAMEAAKADKRCVIAPVAKAVAL